jgi:hypothetical protein
MAVLKITEWTKNQPTSPGWGSPIDFQFILDNPSSIPPEYFDASVISSYLENLYIMFSISSAQPGVIGYQTFQEDANTFLTAVQFDTMQHAEDFYAVEETEPEYIDHFVPARTALLNLFDVQMTLHPPVESSQPFSSMTAADIRALIP